MESSHLQKLIVILNALRLGWWLGLVKHYEELVAFDATVHNDATAVLDTLRISRDRKSSSELLDCSKGGDREQIGSASAVFQISIT